MSKALIVSPHPDDAEIGLGGLIHRVMSAGGSVTVAVCTGDGDLKMVHSGENVAFEKRREEQRKALSYLGDPNLVWLNLAVASRFDEKPQADFVCAFDKLFHDFDEVFVPFPSYNFDHERVWKASMAAFRPGKLDWVSLYAYEQPGQGHADRQSHGLICAKRYYVLSEEDIVAKMRAIDQHESQMGGRSHTLSGVRGVHILAEQRGIEIGEEFAEVVYPVKEVVKFMVV